MIRPKRIVHGLMWGVLGVCLPALFVWTVMARVSIPADEAVQELVPDLAYPIPESAYPMSLMGGQFEIYESRSPDLPNRIIHVVPTRPQALANVLVYWSEGDVAQGTLLGHVRGDTTQVFLLPRVADVTKLHSLVFYSLPQQKVLDRHPLGPGP